MLGYYRLALALGIIVVHGSLMSDGVGRSLVAAFFVISGYIIALTLSKNYHANPLPFYWNRIVRVYPLHIVASAVLVSLWAADAADAIKLTWVFRGDPPPNDTDVALSFLLTRDASDTFNPPAWTLFYELAYYAVAPLLLLARGLPTALAIALALGTLALNGELGLLDDPLGFDSDTGEPLALVSLYFLLGAAAYLVRRRWPQPFGERRRLVEAIALATLVAMLVVSTKWVVDDDLIRFQTDYATPIFLTIVAATVALLLAWDRDRGESRRAAELSFPIYVFHWPVLYLLLDQQPQMADLVGSLGDATRGLFETLTGDGGASVLIVRATLAAIISTALAQIWVWAEERTFRRLRTDHRRGGPIASTAAQPPPSAPATAAQPSPSAT